MSSNSTDGLEATLAQLSLSSTIDSSSKILLAYIHHRSRRGNREIDENTFRNSVMTLLVETKAKVTRGDPDAPHTIVFPVTLTVGQRKIVHQIATPLGLESVGIGEGAQRHVRVIFSPKGYDYLPPPDGEAETEKSTSSSVEESRKWSVEKAKAWYDAQPWLVGCNYIPSSAINQLGKPSTS
jgi:hypothetical protein